MSAGMSLAQFTDLTNSTDPYVEKELGVTMNYRSYEWTNTILPKFKETFTGKQYEIPIQVEDDTNGGHTGMFFVQDNVQITEHDQTLTIYPRHYRKPMTYDAAQIDINSGTRVQRYNWIVSKRIAHARKIADDIKAAGWSAPTSSADADSPLSPFAWLTLGTDGSTGGFTGGNPYYLDGNQFSAGGLSRSTYPKLKSYFADHNGDLSSAVLDMLSRAHLMTKFELPLVPNAQKITGVDTDVPNKVVMYTTANVIINVEKIARNSDDRVGYDLGKYRGETLFKGIPFRHNELFDTGTASAAAVSYLHGTDPIIGINWDVMYPVVVDGWYFRNEKYIAPNTGHVFVEAQDLYWCGVACRNSQAAGFLISQI